MRDGKGPKEEREAPLPPTDYDFKEVEARWQDRWAKDHTYWFDWGSDRPVFSIDNPPRYANAALHLGHATSYTQIDFVARYKRLRGFNVFFPLCADVNGMPIEVATEKRYGVNRKNTPRQRLIELCSAFAAENIAEMTRQFCILGHSMDPSLYYQTDAAHYRRITQLTFLVMLKLGLVYKKEFPVTWCPHCGTALASADVEYQERGTKLNFVRFGREDGGSEVIATTRPELLCACQMVAVNPDDARHRDLLGKGLLTPIYRRRVPVQDDPKVDPDFGTGIVMICTIGDKDDLEWVHRYNLPIEKGIDADGRLTSLAGIYTGMTIREAREAIIKDLQGQGLLVKQEDLSQSVGTCWRCHTPVEFLSVPQWFLRTLEFKDRIKGKSAELRWHPDFMRIRLENWTDSLAWDWCISRQRYFATAIPVWECQRCGKAVPAKPNMCYVDPTVTPPPVDRCPDCGGRLKGVEDVFDTWMDSSITPLYNCFWQRDPEKFKRLFPMSLRPQSHDIIRTWAFYTIHRHLLLFDKRPWTDIMINGFIMAPDGAPMHTSKGNVIDPLPLLARHGADAFRYYAASCTLGMDHAFQSKEVVHGRKLATKLWNVGKFVGAAIREERQRPAAPAALRSADRWILTAYSQMLKRATALMDDYQFDKAMREVEGFLWHEFADHYIELAKHRRDESSRYALYTIGLGLAKMLSPFMPHVTEEIYERHYRAFEGPGSIHRSAWPEPVLDDGKALADGALARDVVARLRAWKGGKGLRLGQPMGSVYIFGPGSEVLRDYLDDMRGALKADRIRLSRPAELREEIIRVLPVNRKLGPAFKARSGEVAAAIGNLDPKSAGEALSKGPLEVALPDGARVQVTPDMVRPERASVAENMRVEALSVGELTVLVELPRK
ncbi:MAG: valine--tRNA ligase [Euryarchaeota archaeon]|nr:valine--tRNA ligase [Euryarchaeota archaeon]